MGLEFFPLSLSQGKSSTCMLGPGHTLLRSVSYRIISFVAGCFLLVFFFFFPKTGSHFIALAGLELTL